MTVTHGKQPLLTGPRILSEADIHSNDALADFPAARLTDGITSWQAGFAIGDGEVIYDLGASKAARMIAIARHNLGSVGATLTVYHSSTGTSGPWTSFGSLAPADDSPTGVLVTEVSSRYWRVVLSGHSAAAYIGDLTVSPVFLLPSGMPVDWTPPSYNRQGKVLANTARNGTDLAGLSIEDEPALADITMDLVNASWFASNWKALFSHLTSSPLYFCWDTTELPDDMMFCWLRQVPQAPLKVAGMYQSTSIQVEGIV